MGRVWTEKDAEAAQARQNRTESVEWHTEQASPLALNLGLKKQQIQLPTPAYADTVTNSATWLFDGGRTSLSLARPHGRQRMAICGAPDEALVAVVVAAIQSHFNQKA